jgi:hypothetical protein
MTWSHAAGIAVGMMILQYIELVRIRRTLKGK